MDQQQPKFSFQKILKGTASPEEQAEFENWYNDTTGEPLQVQSEISKARLAIKLFRNIALQTGIRIHQQPKTRKLWERISIAAAVATMVFGAGLFYYQKRQQQNQQITAYKDDVKPGTQGATLTLAGGKQIKLSEAASGPLASQAGVIIRKTSEGKLIYQVQQQPASNEDQVNTLSTGKGETYAVILPDGTKVWLNAATSLTYNASLIQNGKRLTQLSGEAYFEVAKDKAHPFIVASGNQQVEVLGTHFNINAYPDEPAQATTLVEGSVRVRSGDEQKTIRPGEQALSTNRGIQLRQVEVESFIDWKDGDFYFEKADFRSVMRKIARWYDVEVVYDRSLPETISSSGVISRNRPLSAVLRSIERSGQVRFKIEGRKIIVTQ